MLQRGDVTKNFWLFSDYPLFFPFVPFQSFRSCLLLSDCQGQRGQTNLCAFMLKRSPRGWNWQKIYGTTILSHFSASYHTFKYSKIFLHLFKVPTSFFDPLFACLIMRRMLNRCPKQLFCVLCVTYLSQLLMKTSFHEQFWVLLPVTIQNNLRMYKLC